MTASHWNISVCDVLAFYNFNVLFSLYIPVTDFINATTNNKCMITVITEIYLWDISDKWPVSQSLSVR